jgi:DNA invertase Pin-like site-specific DNA recombinase
MKIAIYQRVSTSKQDAENQGDQLRDFVQRQPWTITHEFTDTVNHGDHRQAGKYPQE